MNKLSFIPKNIIVAISLATLIVNVIKTCPVVCTCKWKGGKRKVECVDKNLTALLTNIDVETQVLDYAKNPLRTLPEYLFEKANLVNLQKLYLAECRISAVRETAFRGLTNLIELDMSGNELVELPAAATFAHLPQLMKLTMAANPLATLPADAFRPLKYLATLDLSNCRLETVDGRTFDGLRKLEWLKLDGNRLKTLKSPYTLPRVTGGLSLHRNPWRCDCHLRRLQRWLTDVTQPSRQLVAEPVCAEPTPHRGVQVARVRFDDLACAPYVVPSSLFVEIDEGKNISFVCQVNAVPEAQITWDFEGRPIGGGDEGGSGGGGNSSLVYPFYKYYAEEATTEQVSELFVFDAKKENNGTYRCTARNVAGVSSSNYTLNVIVAETPAPKTPLTVTHRLHAFFSSASTLVVVVLLVSLIILCLIYANHRKSGVRHAKNVRRSTTTKCRRRYEIVKQTNVAETTDANAIAESVAVATATAAGAAAATANVVAATAATTITATTTSSRRTDANPDLLINTERRTFKEAKPSCERLLLLPGDIKQTYLTLAGNTLLNTTIYESKTLSAHDHQPTAGELTLIPAATSAQLPHERGGCGGGVGVVGGGTIKMYLAPSTTHKFRNLHVNPFDGYVNSTEENCWMLELAEEDCAGEMRHVLIDCYSQPLRTKTTAATATATVATTTTTASPYAQTFVNGDEFVNLRHNLEGYPYPSKLKLNSLKSDLMNVELVDAPILSPPDPFKTGTEMPPKKVESPVNL